MANSVPAPDQGPRSLQVFAAALKAGPPEPEVLETMLAGLESERRLEHAWLILRQARVDQALWGTAQARMKAALEQSRRRRMSRWQTDPDRVTLRLRFAVREPAWAQSSAGLLSLLAGTLMAADLPVAMGLEKSPRPAVHLGHPLPAMVEGCSEWADVVLLEAPPVPLPELPALVNAHAPRGLAVLQCLQVPNYASPVAELCRAAHWRWTCPREELEAAREGLEAFIRCERFEIEKTGKIDGQKGAKRVDIRPLMEACRWEGAAFLFRTRIAPGEAVNPRKLLAAILGPRLDVQGLARTAVDLAEDPRLLQAERFQPKLHNMFEDAVLLGAEGNIRVVDDEEDEPLVLG
jgi:radical SAM-linked protein